MKENFTLVNLDNARCRALRYASNLNNCTFEGYLYCFAHIFNAFSRLGFYCYLQIEWSPDYSEKLYRILIRYSKGPGKGFITAMADILDDGNPSYHAQLLTDEINRMCDEVNRWYLDPKTSPLL